MTSRILWWLIAGMLLNSVGVLALAAAVVLMVVVK